TQSELDRNTAAPEICPDHDPWDPIHTQARDGRHPLTSVEVTVSHLCNMRCEHCAVGDSLVTKEGDMLPLDRLLHRLEEISHLETISITGGEPAFRRETVRSVIVPLLRYARQRGLRSQLNSNITMDLERYEEIAPYLDVLHISHNYTSAEEFREIGFARAANPSGNGSTSRLYERMMNNARALARGGLFVSAESMINYRTHDKLPEIHRLIVEMGCKRHEVHPMYPSAFARHLPVLGLDEIRQAVNLLLETRDPSVWMLFGTLPFYACNENKEDRTLLERLHSAPKVTVRNDPDGRNRLNVSLFDGNVHVTDFADFPPLGNIARDRLDDVFTRWLEHPLSRTVSCHCPAASCCGPNLLVKDTYYKDEDFTVRKAPGNPSGSL
ncbi:MAG: yfkAB, partial [Paenibacillaceae bacterium]|nr:yfkAB [Paenibacillaceae bacterium]